MRAAVFLDRDGVINRERDTYTWQVQDIELLPGIADALRAIRASGRLAIVITNQGGVGRGLYTKADVERAHAWISAELARAGARVDAFLYCPHHPDSGRCLCRKPGSLLIERALTRHGISARRSVMVGDRERDVEAAQAAGVQGILIPSNSPFLHLLDLSTLSA